MWDSIGKGLAIVLVNTVLSGDNALVIAMVTTSLAPAQRVRGVVYGLSLTVILRVMLTLVAGKIFVLPYLEALGGLLLVYFAFSLSRTTSAKSDRPDATKTSSSGRLFRVVLSIIVADLSMSLDNVIALAGIANGDWSLLLIGMAISILIIFLASQVLTRLLLSHPWLMYVGAGILAWTGGGMIGRDPVLSGQLAQVPFLPIWISVVVLVFAYGLGKIRNSRD